MGIETEPRPAAGRAPAPGALAPGRPAVPDAFLVVVKAGPVYEFADHLKYQAELLSRLFRGLVLTHGPRAEVAHVGRMELRKLALDDVAPTRAQRAAYVAAAARAGRRAIAASGLPGLVVTYDPLVSGVIGRLIAVGTRTRLICELNGAFGSPALYPADANGAARRRRVLGVGSAVLRGASGLRLLFDEQLDGFHVDLRGKTVRRFFDPIPLERFTNLGEEPNLLFVGFPYWLKGVDLLLHAFARVRDRFPGWTLTLIGHDLGRYVAASGVSLERVEVLKAMSNERLAPHIGRCAALVLPSRTEAMGRVLLEAAAAGKPRVGASVDGIPTVIDDGVDGLLFPSGDVDALADRLQRLMGDANLRARLGVAARARAEREFSGERFLELFGEMAASVLRARA